MQAFIFSIGSFMLCRLSLILLSCLLLLSIPVAPAFAELDRPVLVQVLLGAAQYDEDSLTFNAQVAGEDIRENLSKMPVFGVIGQYPLSLGKSQFGVEWGGLFGWRSRKTSIYSTISSTRIRVETSFWLFDLSVGLYGSQTLGNNWRIYAAAGPTMLFASYSEDREATPVPLSASDARDNSSEQFGVGGYARVGVDYQISPGAYVGICGRGLVSNLEFDSHVADGQLSGIQGFLTFSREF